MKTSYFMGRKGVTSISNTLIDIVPNTIKQYSTVFEVITQKKCMEHAEDTVNEKREINAPFKTCYTKAT
jgi:hypothetical protein